MAGLVPIGAKIRCVSRAQRSGADTCLRWCAADLPCCLSSHRSGGDCAASCSAVKAASRRAFGGGLRPALTTCARRRKSAAVIDGSSCRKRGRTSHLLLIESIADGGVEPHQEFAHHRNQDHLAWFAASAQTIAEVSLISGSHRIAVRAGLNRMTLTQLRPGARPRRLSVRPLCGCAVQCRRARRFPGGQAFLFRAIRRAAPVPWLVLRPCARTSPSP